MRPGAATCGVRSGPGTARSGLRCVNVARPMGLGASFGMLRRQRDVVMLAGRGRPRKTQGGYEEEEEPVEEPVQRRGRGRPKKDAAAEEETLAAIVAAAAPQPQQPVAPQLSWPEAAAAGATEEDPRRFGFHRRLQLAAQRGDAADAEATLSDMGDVGLAPGPRAWHVLVVAHLKAGDVDGALDASVRAGEAGVRLLPETWCALVYGMTSGEEPDVQGAQRLVEMAQGAGADTAAMRCVLLCQLTASGAYEAAVQEGAALTAEGPLRPGAPGLDARLFEDTTACYVEALCATGQESEALVLFGEITSTTTLEAPWRLVAPIVRASALAGAIQTAQQLLDECVRDGLPLDASCYNGLLEGLVRAMTSPGADTALSGGAAAEPPPPPSMVMSDSVFGLSPEDQFLQVKDQMVRANVRPDEGTWVQLLAGHVKLKSPDAAMGAFKSVRAVGALNACQRIPEPVLSGLLNLLADADRPVDLLTVLTGMGEDFCPLPAAAMQPDDAGRTLVARWLPQHLGVLAVRAQQKAAREAASASTFRDVDGVSIGIGDCVVDEAGVPQPLSKMSMAELRAEAEARGMGEGPAAIDIDGAKRPELNQLLKSARAALPYGIQQRIKALEASRKRARGGAREAAKASVKGLRRITVETWNEGKMVLSQERMMRPPRAKFMKSGDSGNDSYYSFNAGSEGSAVPMEYAGSSSLSKVTEQLDLEATLQAEYLAEGAQAIMAVGDEDIESGYAQVLRDANEEEDEEEEEEGAGASEGEPPLQSETRDEHERAVAASYKQLAELEASGLDAQEANASAGLSVALDMAQLLEAMEAQPSAGDVLAMATAAGVESSPSGALAVARRLKIVANAQRGANAFDAAPEVASANVPALAVGLVNICLDAEDALAADECLEVCEDAGLLTAPDALLDRLNKALGGRPRRKEARARRALTDGPDLEGVASQALSALGLEDEEEAAAPEAETPALDAAAAARTRTAAVEAEAAASSEVQEDEGGEQGEGEIDVYEEFGRERALRRALLLQMGMGEVLNNDEIDNMLDDPKNLHTYEYGEAALAQMVLDRQAYAQELIACAIRAREEFTEEELEETGMLEAVQAIESGDFLEEHRRDMAHLAERAGLVIDEDGDLALPEGMSMEEWVEQMEAREDARAAALNDGGAAYGTPGLETLLGAIMKDPKTMEDAARAFDELKREERAEAEAEALARRDAGLPELVIEEDDGTTVEELFKEEMERLKAGKVEEARWREQVQAAMERDMELGREPGALTQEDLDNMMAQAVTLLGPAIRKLDAEKLEKAGVPLSEPEVAAMLAAVDATRRQLIGESE